MNPDLLKWILCLIVILNFLFGFILKWLNHKSWQPNLPEVAKGIYSEDEYRKAYLYHRENFRFSLWYSVPGILLLILFLYFDGFARVDGWLRSFIDNPYLLTVVFFLVLGLAADVLKIPFDLYGTFVIEEKYGFNRTTTKTWLADKLKGYLLAIIVGGGLLLFLTWIYYSTGNWFWFIAWLTVSVISLLTTILYTSLLVPLFNKLVPLEAGSLRDKIEEYCSKVGFKLDRVFVIDGSKRSSRGNAYFSGLGPRKSIVLFDTLIQKHSEEELVAVLAHETGHYKLKHIGKGIAIGILQTLIIFLLLGFALNYPMLSYALGSEIHSFHLAMVGFFLLFTPVSTLAGIFANRMSRKHEFEADAYARETYGGAPLQQALLKLSRDNLSNLTPHPAYVFVHYSHPPVVERVAALELKHL